MSTEKQVAPVPKVGDRAPWSDQIQFPSAKPVLLVFLRHCGCPFAEKTFRSLATFSVKHPSVHCIAVSHCSQADTDGWVIKVGGEWNVEVVVDESRELYRQWGLGTTSTWYAMSPWNLYSAYRLGEDEGIWGTAGGPGYGLKLKTGSRWQMGGAFAIDASGFVRWTFVPRAANHLPSFQDALRALEAAKSGATGLA
ncbi:hypothetical protein B0H63DRAFT_453193 [Podospora didyma]|uniref:Alkyl hydroperoxide reductase subunit C/ Thiol specific antioxidant domain-containing protein n=1 Tax=Podospora didyma TaxID=330526 RepID=A0AAE0N965_9PEZI|nr:hypothetical protein B0H63DRAFT_453193 [Podospora didyma]